MSDTPDPTLPPSLRFLKALVITLMITLIGGVIAMVFVLVTRLPGAATLPHLPDNLALATVDGLLHGFGVDILPPTLSGNFAPPQRAYTLETGVTIVLQPNPAMADERMGMQLGEMGVVTERGFESMHASPAEVTICG